MLFLTKTKRESEFLNRKPKTLRVIFLELDWPPSEPFSSCLPDKCQISWDLKYSKSRASSFYVNLVADERCPHDVKWLISSGIFIQFYNLTTAEISTVISLLICHFSFVVNPHCFPSTILFNIQNHFCRKICQENVECGPSKSGLEMQHL